MSIRDIARLLRVVAEIVDNNDPDEIREAAQILIDRRKRSARLVKTQKEDLRLDLIRVAEELSSTTNREDARKMLNNIKLTRTELTSIARFYNIHTVKEDNLGTIESKLVEALVGARLSSKAIRGE